MGTIKELNIKSKKTRDKMILNTNKKKVKIISKNTTKVKEK